MNKNSSLTHVNEIITNYFEDKIKSHSDIKDFLNQKKIL